MQFLHTCETLLCAYKNEAGEDHSSNKNPTNHQNLHHRWAVRKFQTPHHLHQR